MKILLVQIDGKMPKPKSFFGIMPNMPYREWRPDEIEKLRRAYTEKISPLILLPDRTNDSIRHKASRLGLKWWESEDRCHICGVELSEDNWYPSSKERRDRTCKECVKAKSKKNKDPDWGTLNQLHTSGITYLCRKRPKPDLCELCKKKPPKAYHHWGEIVEGAYVAGIWLDHRCHQFAELFDQGYSEKYQEIKEAILVEGLVSPN